jgi:ABC-type transporter Mla subunit MlaD
MAKVHRSYRLEEETISRVDAYASAHGIKQTEAVEMLLTSALNGDRETEASTETVSDVAEVLRGNLVDLRRHADTLAAQLEEKDQQIKALSDIANHAQALQAADKQLTAATDDTKPGRRKLFGHWFSREDKQ